MPASPRFALVAAGWTALGAALLAGAALAALALPDPETDVVSIDLPWRGKNGGWSGIDVSPDGTRFWAVTDSGRFAAGRLLRDGDDRLTGIEAPTPEPLRGELSRIESRDAEGIDVRWEEGGEGGGQAYVSFEIYHRLRRFDAPGGEAQWLPDPPQARHLQGNYGLEAVARDARGDIYTLPERIHPRAPDSVPLPLWRFTRYDWMSEDHWQLATHIQRDPDWYAVGADFGPDGLFYLLERRFNGIGFASRIRRFDLSHATRFTREAGEIVYRSPLGRHGNLEGIGLWQDGAGRLRAVMVADDNRKFFQRAEVVEVTLPSAAPLASGHEEQ